MMKTAGIVAEYNPFHNGHRYLAEQTRAAGATHIIAVMSGSFVQRGEPAIFSKWQRTKTALRNGVDLVLELPVPYALGSAERFAAGAVATLSATGCPDFLSFGSESGSIPALQQAADACILAERSDTLARLLKEGLPYPAARERAVAELTDPDNAALLSMPNNTLGIEYLKAMRQQNVSFSALTFRREGAAHDGAPSGQYASASWLRQAIADGAAEDDILRYLPQGEALQATLPLAAKTERLEAAVLWRLRSMSAADFALLPDVTEGLENRLYAAVQEAVGIDDFLFRVKTKRYPLARLRRIVWCAMIGIEKRDVVSPPAYLRILGFNSRGRELLQKMKATAAFPLVSSFVELEQLAPRFALLEKTATDLQGLAVSPPLPCNRDYTEKIVVLDR